jgi:hypothetical protein
VVIAPKDPKLPEPKRSRYYRLSDDTESQFSRILGRAVPSSLETDATSQQVLTSLVLNLMELETLSVSRTLAPVASIALTTHAALVAARTARAHGSPQHSGSRRPSSAGVRRGGPAGGPGSAEAAGDDAQEMPLAFHTVQYDAAAADDATSVASTGQGLRSPTSTGGGPDCHQPFSRNMKEHAVMAVTSHGRVLLWDTGNAEVRSRKHCQFAGACCCPVGLCAAPPMRWPPQCHSLDAAAIRQRCTAAPQ